MSGPGNVSSWTLTPEQRAAYAAGMTLARMDLGEPHRVDPPVLRMTSAPPPTPAPKKEKPKLNLPAPTRRIRIPKHTIEEYIDLVASTNMTRDEVAQHWDIKARTLATYLSNWGIGKPKDEAAAVEAYRRGAL